MLSVLLPTAYRAPRGALLVFGFGCLLLVLLRDGRMRVHREVMAWALLNAVVSCAFMIWGGLQGAPGVPRVITVYVIWPVIYTLALGAFASTASQWSVARGLLVAQALIVAFTIHFVLYTAGFLPVGPPIDLNQSISLSGGNIEFSFYPLNSLIYLVPFSLAALMIWRFENAARRNLVTVVALAGAAIGVMSGRRALQLVVVLAPFMTLGFVAFAPVTLRQLAVKRGVVLVTSGLIVLLGLLVAVIVFLHLDVTQLLGAFTEGFEQSDDLARSPRAAQLAALLNDWSAQPLFGAGLGATASSVIRSNEQPWAYELSYVALLFQVGIAGFVFYSLAVGWIYARGLQFSRRDPQFAQLLIPNLTGMTSFLIANATNPYLSAFDYLWTLFLPIAVINGCMLAASRRADGSRP